MPPATTQVRRGSSRSRSRRGRERGPGVHADRVACGIYDQGDGSPVVVQVEGKPGHDGSSQLSRLLAAGLDVGYLDVDDAVERTDLALRDTQRPDRRAARDDLDRQIGSLKRRETPVEKLAVELFRLREVGR